MPSWPASIIHPTVPIGAVCLIFSMRSVRLERHPSASGEAKTRELPLVQTISRTACPYPSPLYHSIVSPTTGKLYPVGAATLCSTTTIRAPGNVRGVMPSPKLCREVARTRVFNRLGRTLDAWETRHNSESEVIPALLLGTRDGRSELRRKPPEFSRTRKRLNLLKNRSDRWRRTCHQSSKRVHDGEPVLPSPNSTP